MHKIIALIGPNESQCSEEIRAFGQALGKELAEEGYNLVNGGLGGFMEAVFRGAKSSNKASIIRTIGILPGEDIKLANSWCDIVIPSGLGISRNALVVRTGDIVIAVGGGGGTLSEIALAWQMGKKVICIEGYGGWSEKMAGSSIDSRRDDILIRAKSLSEVKEALKDLIH